MKTDTQEGNAWWPGDPLLPAMIIAESTSNGWWPIESAPGDGVPVDLWVLDINGIGARLTNCWCLNGRWRKPLGELPENLRPTHWRSIPSGPRRA